ncbi:MAG: WYL domain-containing protein, partial [Caloramator sp.]|nr:WYL domain-containing protein [Caloramator sp.]
EYYDKFNKLSERRVKKQNISLNAFDKGLVKEFYRAIENKNRMVLELKSGKKMSIIPCRILYEDDTGRWYIEALRKGRCFVIDLDNIIEINKEDSVTRKMADDLYTSFGIGKRILHVKLRVYNEKNAKERAIRFLLRKNITEQKSFEDYIEIKAKVSDIAMFKRWLREMGPSAVLLEPKWLRQEMVDNLHAWRNIYE